MKVKELIAELQKQNQEMRVGVLDRADGESWNDVEHVDIMLGVWLYVPEEESRWVAEPFISFS